MHNRTAELDRARGPGYGDSFKINSSRKPVREYNVVVEAVLLLTGTCTMILHKSLITASLQAKEKPENWRGGASRLSPK